MAWSTSDVPAVMVEPVGDESVTVGAALLGDEVPVTA